MCSPVSMTGRSDARLHKDDVDICFSKTLNSCKVPQIRYASVERLLERLTDLRFLSIDFLNTFLHTYRIFTTAAVVMDKLADIYKKPFTSIPVRLELLSLSSFSPFKCVLQCKGNAKTIHFGMFFSHSKHVLHPCLNANHYCDDCDNLNLKFIFIVHSTVQKNHRFYFKEIGTLVSLVIYNVF
jgi:hypothetical protein